MSVTALAASDRSAASFRHEALFYAGKSEFVAGTSAFIREGLAAGESVLTVVSAEKIDLLRADLGVDEKQVCFADMDSVGINPARIIPAWREFVSEGATSGRGWRGIGEPVWVSRTAAELVECERHESLLNLAFADSPGWKLLCPYDTDVLAPDVIEAARRTHPFVVEGEVTETSSTYEGLDIISGPFDRPLPAAPAHAWLCRIKAGSLLNVREFVARHAATAGLRDSAAEDLVLAVNELAANTLRHGGGRGTLRMWLDGETVVCEVRDRGRIEDALVGRERPETTTTGGRGLWMVNQLCDLTQVRSLPSGTVVRLHMRRR
jgi:anti-sigma regulatory factor (Ser/Thr protein kinase)